MPQSASNFNGDNTEGIQPLPASGNSETEREMTPEEEAQITTALQEVKFSMNRLLMTMDYNISLLEDSVREVKTAHNILAESNRLSRLRLLREGDSVLTVTSK